MSFLRIHDISKSFENQKVLDRVSLEFNLNEFVFVIGESGSGKTTLLNVLGLLTVPEEGEIFINEKAIKNKEREKLRYGFYSFVYQNDFLLDNYSIDENINLVNKNNKIKSEELLEKVSLNKQKDSNINVLSGGEKQRVSIARALSHLPKILIADEPTSSLDETNKEKAIKLLKDNSEGRLTIISTHDIKLAKKYATRIIKIENGKAIEIYNNPISTINKTNSSIPYKEYSILGSIRSAFKHILNSFKKPITLISIFALFLTITLSLIGASVGIKGVVNNEINRRLDSRYYEITCEKNPNECFDIFDNNNIDYIEYKNIGFLFNYFLKEEFKEQNEINFDFDFSIIDYKYFKIKNNNFAIVNNLFSNQFKNEEFNLNSLIEINGDNSKVIIKNLRVKEINESTIYNNPKVYLDYNYCLNLLNDVKFDNLLNKINIPKYIFIASNINDFNNLLESSNEYIDITEEENKNYSYVYNSSNIILTKGLSPLVDSISKLMIYLIVIVACCLVMLFSLMLEQINKERQTEYALKYSFGIKKKDIVKDIFIEAFIIMFSSYLISCILYFLIHYLFKVSIIKMVKFNTSNLVEFEIKALLTGLYIVLISSIICTFESLKSLKIDNIYEVLKNE